MMKTFSLFAMVVACAMPAYTQDEKAWSLKAGVDYADKYLFRGLLLTGDEPILIPSVAFGVGNLNVYYYGYFGKIEGFGSDHVEHDFSLDYGIPLGDCATLKLGAVTYLYGEEAERDIALFDTYEVYGILVLDTPLSPTISYFEDLDAVDGGYASFGLSHSFTLGSRAALKLSGQVGVDFGYNLNENLAASLGIEESNGDLSDGLLGVDLSVSFTDSLSGHVLVQRVIALDVLDDLGKDDETVVTGGLGWSF